MKNVFPLLLFVCAGQLTAQTITTVSGNGTAGFGGDGGPATAAKLHWPTHVIADAAGNLFISDESNHRIRRVSVSGIITTVAGNGTPGFSGDGGPATAAKLNYPFAAAIDASGNLYISDNLNTRIRKVDTFGTITTIAGDSTGGFSGDGGPATAAELGSTTGITLDGTGNLYIADNTNNRIRLVTASGIINTIAGNGTAGYSGDGGPATATELNRPTGVTPDAAGNLYIADYTNNCIRKINSSGIITTVAGNGIQGFSGDGGPATSAELFNPEGVAFDGAGIMYIADRGNHRIRMVNPSGIISTAAGTGTPGFSGDGGQAIAAELNYPTGVAVTASGTLYISDLFNNRIRAVTLVSGINTYRDMNEGVTLGPNPACTMILIDANHLMHIDLYDVLGHSIRFETGDVVQEKVQIDISHLQNGIYFIRMKTDDGVITRKIVVQH